MMIVRWAPIREAGPLPPFGQALCDHISQYRGAVKDASCSAWTLLYEVLREQNLPVGTVAFEENGKPYFTEQHCHFSISHSREICAVAVADRRVGVDAEAVRGQVGSRLTDKVLTDPERACFDGDFIRVWCRKEAVAKMTGRGITGYPVDIDTTDTGYHFWEELIEYGQNTYRITACTEDPGHGCPRVSAINEGDHLEVKMEMKETVLKILAEVKPTKNLEAVNDIVEGGYIDSFELMLLITKLCEEFQIEIGFNDVTPDNFNSVERIVNMVERLRH